MQPAVNALFGTIYASGDCHFTKWKRALSNFILFHRRHVTMFKLPSSAGISAFSFDSAGQLADYFLNNVHK
jgi:hypothetical protein